MKLISYISGFMIPFLLFYVVGHGLLSKRDIYSDFLEGAKAAPSEGLFRSQSKEYQNSIIPTGAKVFGKVDILL